MDEALLCGLTAKNDKYACADLSKYKDSMCPLIEKDIGQTLAELTGAFYPYAP